MMPGGCYWQDDRICNMLGAQGGFQWGAEGRVGGFGAGVLPAGRCSRRQRRYQPHRERARKMSCQVRRGPTSSSDSSVGLLVQAVQFRFNCFLIQLVGSDQNCDRLMVELAGSVWFLKPCQNVNFYLFYNYLQFFQIFDIFVKISMIFLIFWIYL